MAVARSTTSAWTLWAVAVSCALHSIDEYLSGWQAWAHETLGITMPTALFVLANTVLVIAAVVIARTGWKRPTASLVIPAATLANAIFFHIVPSAAQQHLAPGVVTAALLYVPFSTWAFVGAWRSGVERRAIVTACGLGMLMMVGFVSGVRYLVS